VTVLESHAPIGRTRADERALVEQLLAGDEAAFTAVVQRYHGPLLRFARMFVRDGTTAEEVVQDTWLAVLTGLPSFQGRSTLKSWIFSILANRAKTRAVRDKRSITFSELAPGLGHAPTVEPERFTPAGGWAAPPDRWDEDTPEKLLLRREALAVARQAVAALPAGQQAVLTLRDIEGFDAAEVCNVLEISETNQRVLLHRARSKVRAAFERYLAEGASEC
jgi:RNA polymerase sigma-70 factor (ECF subfamily)